eukprot:5308091-Pleurochrysis_carterae.AAC.1
MALFPYSSGLRTYTAYSTGLSWKLIHVSNIQFLVMKATLGIDYLQNGAIPVVVQWRRPSDAASEKCSKSAAPRGAMAAKSQ